MLAHFDFLTYMGYLTEGFQLVLTAIKDIHDDICHCLFQGQALLRSISTIKNAQTFVQMTFVQMTFVQMTFVQMTLFK